MAVTTGARVVRETLDIRRPRGFEARYKCLGASQVMLVKKEPTCQSRRYKGYGFNSWVGKIPLRRSWQPTPVFLPGESHGQRRLEAYSPWDHKESITAKETWHAGKHTRA